MEVGENFQVGRRVTLNKYIFLGHALTHFFLSHQDVYSDIVELVEARRQQDAEAGVEIAQTLEGFVKRKTIKQTIMTTVYGVTMYGAKLQVSESVSQ